MSTEKGFPVFISIYFYYLVPGYSPMLIIKEWKFFNIKNKRQHIQLSKKRPRYAVCCRVLNLPKQDGYRHRRPALAEAYRVTLVSEIPLFKVLAQNRCCSITHTAGYFSYTMNRLKWVDMSSKKSFLTESQYGN